MALTSTVNAGTSTPLSFTTVTCTVLSAVNTIESKKTFVGNVPPFVMPKAAPLSASKTLDAPSSNVTSKTAVLPFGIAPVLALPVNTFAPATAVAAQRPLAVSLVWSMTYTSSAAVLEPSSQLKRRFNDSICTSSLFVGWFNSATNAAGFAYCCTS